MASEKEIVERYQRGGSEVMYIEELTEEQKALMPVVRDRWIEIGLSTDTNKEKAEAGIRLAYSLAGLKEPKEIIWCENPVEACLKYIELKKKNASVGDSVGDSVCDSVGDSVWDSVWASVWDSVGDSVWDSVWASVWDSVWASVGASVWASVGDSVWDSVWASWDSVWASVGASVWDSVGDSVRASISGLSECYRLAFYDYFREVGLELKTIEGLVETSKHCGMWWALDGIAIASPKPTSIHRNAEGRLHADGIPAVSYKGFGVWAWNGILLPEKYRLSSERWEPKWLLEEDNAELRRVLIEGIGYDRICSELGARVIDEWREYSLVVIRSEVDVEPIHLLKMVCPSTNHLHTIRVPPDISKAKEAIKWCNWGVDATEFTIET